MKKTLTLVMKSGTLMITMSNSQNLFMHLPDGKFFVDVIGKRGRETNEQIFDNASLAFEYVAEVINNKKAMGRFFRVDGNSWGTPIHGCLRGCVIA